ncbi:DotD/TraH family lipoprotein [Trinickia diaoshuihuensis]|uniref:DotD/TraH family lipoprotein n=1 Tax=Trinickia diaoshuihuensis TaxID=2292265 RepID=UPI0013C329B0|nr:DotD/TraH family lipoprotein [Trinickia diaoshuihuensis]
MKLVRVAVSVLACLFAGCATQSEPADPTGRMLDSQLNDSAHRIDTLLGDISRAGGISAVAPRSGVVLVAGDFITVRWNGDAPEVLRKIAEAKGLKFSVAGKPIASPIAIDATNTDFVSVLENIGTQLGARADVVLKTDSLELRYRAL